MKTLSRLLLLLSFFVYCSPLLASERITSFDSKVSIDESGLLTVIETIAVVAEGKQIKRGIYRDFPTKYTNKAGHSMRVGFTLLDVQRNEQSEPFHTERVSNGIRIYIGDKDTFLKRGPHTYTITYQTDRQIGFFLDYDELYWNVTGNGWAFPIEEVSTTIILPPNASVLQHSLYTGRQGATLSNGEVMAEFGNQISFQTTLPLAPQEGFTVAVAWPKGIVKEPDMKDRAAFYFRDNITLVAGVVGLIILFFYYSIAWSGVGKDPDGDAIIPRFEPPEGFTPAASRFVMQMGFDNKAFASAVVSLAVKNHLTIDDDKGIFTLKRRTDAKNMKPLSKGEKKIIDKLFSGSTSVELKQANHKKIGKAVSTLKKSVQTDFEIMHFKRNTIYMVPGLVITLLIILAVIVTAPQKAEAGFITLWLSGWSAGCYFLFLRTYNSWQVAFSSGSGVGDKLGAVFSTFFALPFLGGLLFGTFIFITAVSFGGVVALMTVLFINFLFYHLLKAPTLQGRKIMDQLEGLKLYLTVAEKEKLNLLNPPEKTPELFEKFLPWALALDVEQQWSEQFSDLLEKAARDGSYSPGWYSSQRPFTSASLASSLGSSLASTISSSSHAPGSSSGSGGGGSSGGGGGGGGGGGW